MTRWVALGVVVTASLGARPGVVVAENRIAVVTTIQLDKGLAVDEATMADIDDDGASDLLVVAGGRRSRNLLIYRSRPGEAGFEPAPDATLELTADVVGYAAGDVSPDPGREIVLFSARGVYAWQPGRERQPFVKLIDADFLWQLPQPRRTVSWQDGVRDLNGDGLEDLLVPEAGGYRLAVQSRIAGAEAAFDTVNVLTLPAEAGDDPQKRSASILYVRRDQGRLKFEIRRPADAGEATGPLLDVMTSVPAPQLVDWDGDGDLDLLALADRTLHVWIQQDGGRFVDVHPDGFVSPVAYDRGRLFDVSWGAHAADLNGDRRVDCVMLAGDQRARDVRTQVLVYVQPAGGNAGAGPAGSPLFGADGIPQQVLVIGGFAGEARLDDVDGDGRPDLVVSALRPDLLDKIGARDSVEVELYVYRNRGGRFSTHPDLTHVLRLPTKELEEMNDGVLARFFADVTGDGIQELIAREEPTRVKVLLAVARGGRLSLADRALWQTRCSAQARLRIPDRGAREPPQLLILEKDQVLHVRFP